MATVTGYSGTPLADKLGIRPDIRLLVDHAPHGFPLGPLPPGVRPHRRPGAAPYDLILTFCPDRATLAHRFGPLASRLTRAGALWIGWPKRASGVVTDLAENQVREVGLAAGLVDVKVCALDRTWSGLKFVYRLADR